jgi:hypothetical protein
MFTQSLIAFVALAGYIATPVLAVPGAAWVRRQEDAQTSRSEYPSLSLISLFSCVSCGSCLCEGRPPSPGPLLGTAVSSRSPSPLILSHSADIVINNQRNRLLTSLLFPGYV